MLRGFYTIIDDGSKQIGFSMKTGSNSFIYNATVMQDDNNNDNNNDK